MRRDPRRGGGGSRTTADLFAERSTRAARRIPAGLWPIVRRTLKWLEVATRLSDLASSPGNRLEALKGDPRGRHSLRPNDQDRLTFRWEGNHACEVRCEDYHP
jgi:proteic killer suppression protein